MPLATTSPMEEVAGSADEHDRLLYLSEVHIRAPSPEYISRSAYARLDESANGAFDLIPCVIHDLPLLRGGDGNTKE